MKISNDPWQYLTIDNLLSPKRWKELQELAQIELDCYYKSNDRTVSGKWIRWLDEDILPEANVAYKMLPESRPLGNNMKKIMHWTVCPPNWEFPKHCDYDARIHTTVLYISPEESFGTILCKNNADTYTDYGASRNTTLPSEYEKEVKWKQNRLFAFNTLDQTWHYYKSGDKPRVIIQSFFVDVDKIVKGKEELDHLIDLDYENLL
jgi:hypothetical protein|tara:strand:- start:2571 stop:3188 length:618 start_codon:yes stop_codon:yes gene_type:complete